jgi:hypothetical protein
MSAPFFVDEAAALAMRAENARKAYAARQEGAGDDFTRAVYAVAERLDPVDAALHRWLIGEMARGTPPRIALKAVGVLLNDFVSSMAGCEERNADVVVAEFIATLMSLRREPSEAIEGRMEGTSGGRA